jgi:predicted  nucleic acid-binding Zn-ribbon protein
VAGTRPEERSARADAPTGSKQKGEPQSKPKSSGGGADERELEARTREVGALSQQLKQVRDQLRESQAALQAERGKMRQALLASRSMAECSLDYSAEQEARLLAKVEGQVQDCSVEDLHWLMTRTFRSWLAQSYSECDEVCGALEAEQQRLKRSYYSKEQELAKMRAHASHLKTRVVWIYQVSRQAAPSPRAPLTHTGL